MEKKVTQKKTTSNKTTKPKSSGKQSTTKQTTKKSSFDVHDFVFKTKIQYVLNWMKYMEEELDDVNSEWLDGETYDLYAVWLRDINHYINNGIPWTLLSARERYLMGIFNPETKKSLDDNDKP